MNYLHCSLFSIYNYIAHTTPIDVYLFLDENVIQNPPKWFSFEFPQLHILPILSESWQVPTNIGSHATWNMNEYTLDYYLQGRWRLTYQMQFCYTLGYKYVLQVDDDTFILNSNHFNIVERMKSEGKVLGVRQRTFTESKRATRGLAEFTRYLLYFMLCAT